MIITHKHLADLHCTNVPIIICTNYQNVYTILVILF